MPSRSFLTLLCADLPRSRDWYVDLAGYAVEFDSDWFVNLQSRDQPAAELGLLRRDHEIVPETFRATPAGAMLTVVVDDVDAVHELARQRGEQVVEEPRDLFYGQRRMLLVDPDGLLVDLSSECAPDPDWLASLG